jgi:hypothetical protein
MSLSFSCVDINTQSGFLSKIESYLDAKDQTATFRVCKLWNQISQERLCRREQVKALGNLNISLHETIPDLPTSHETLDPSCPEILAKYLGKRLSIKTQDDRIAYLHLLSDEQKRCVQNLSLMWVSDEQITELLPFFPNLKSLETHSHNLTGAFLNSLPICSQLESLRLAGRGIEEGNLIAFITGNTCLKTLEIDSKSGNIRGDFIRSISENNQLENLTLMCSSLRENELTHLLIKCPHLDRLEVNALLLTSRFLTEIEGYSTLKALSWNGYRFSIEDASIVSLKYPYLKDVEILAYDMNPELLAFLNENDKLENLLTYISRPSIRSLSRSSLESILMKMKNVTWNQKTDFLNELARRTRNKLALGVTMSVMVVALARLFEEN